MNSIIKSTGEYISNKFAGKNGTWVLVGTETLLGGKVMDCQDQFRNPDTGKRITIIRSKVYEFAEKKDIYLP